MARTQCFGFCATSQRLGGSFARKRSSSFKSTSGMPASPHAYLSAALPGTRRTASGALPLCFLASAAHPRVSLLRNPHRVLCAPRLPARPQTTRSCRPVLSSAPMPDQSQRDVSASRFNMPQTRAPQKRSFMQAFRNPAKLRADILMSIKPEHMSNIAAGVKNHEYRKYLLPSSVKRIWFYTSTPVSTIHFVAQVSRGRKPGEVPEDGGLGNDDFNAGRKVSKYGYGIQKLWRLRNPITLPLALSKGYLKGPPQKYNWAPAPLIEEYPLESQDCVLNRTRKKNDEQKENVAPEEMPGKKMKTVSQGQKENLIREEPAKDKIITISQGSA